MAEEKKKRTMKLNATLTPLEGGGEAIQCEFEGTIDFLLKVAATSVADFLYKTSVEGDLGGLVGDDAFVEAVSHSIYNIFRHDVEKLQTIVGTVSESTKGALEKLGIDADPEDDPEDEPDGDEEAE